MKAKTEHWVTVVGFCAFLGVAAALYLFLPRSEYSEREKRYLAKSPTLTIDSLVSGEYGEDLETYMADHIPARDFFVGLNAYADLLSGRQVSKEIYVAEENRLVEAPVLWNEVQATKNIAAVDRLAKALDQKVDLMIVPSAGWAVEDQIIGLADPYTDKEQIERLYAMTNDRANTVDVLSAFAAESDRGVLYYKTDHHWTSFGAYKAYSAYMAAKDRAYPAAEEFAVTVADGFQGSTYSRAALWLTPSEPLELWKRTSRLFVTNSKTNQPHEGVFYTERLNEADKYTVFLDGNQAIVRIENPENVGKGSALVIRDSYANCLGPFLAESYETVVLVDPRYYKQPITELCDKEEFTDVLVCYSLGNFMTDNNLVWLK
ncbi:MAG: hypothetical protein IJN61_01485 [Clostridia bacterium]|nr:hypothetical protein [Clostridia bacterium]